MIPIYEPWIRKKYIKEVTKQFKSGWIGPGKTTELLEQKICDITKFKYCVTVNSGTTAILLSLIANNIPRNKKIIVPYYGYVAAANCARFLNYDILPIDVNPIHGCLSYKHLQVKNKDEIGGIVYINHNGQTPEDYYQYFNMAEKYNIPFISDSAVAFSSKKRFVGDCVTFSFSVPKIITSGQGGAILTNKLHIFNRLLELRDQGNNWRVDRNHKNIGLNFRMPDILSSFILAQLNDLNIIEKRREKIWNYYNKFKNNLNIDLGWCAILRTKSNLEKIQKTLNENNISASRFYLPLFRNKAYSYLSLIRPHYFGALSVYNDSLFLPSSLTLTKKQIKNICEIIQKC